MENKNNNESLPAVQDHNHLMDTIQATKITLEPNDILAVTVKCDDLSPESLEMLKYQLNDLFAPNKVALFGMPANGDVSFSIVKPAETSYCSDCNCGKKESYEKE